MMPLQIPCPDADEIAQNKDSTEKLSALMLRLLCVLNWRDNLIEPARCILPARTKCGGSGSKAVSKCRPIS